MNRGFFALLSENPHFTRVFFAGTISQIGDWFNTIAIFTMIHTTAQNSASLLSWVIVIKQLPLVFLSPVAGTIADRFDRRRVMIVTDLLRAGLVAMLLVPGVASSTAAVCTIVTLQALCFSILRTGASSSHPARRIRLAATSCECSQLICVVRVPRAWFDARRNCAGAGRLARCTEHRCPFLPHFRGFARTTGSAQS